ncbi:fibronectin type III domain-containing protein [Myxococcus sp. AM010]|uniref:fibronectin type III domain-containing protein n=1 Tax=Myxococcus sp. AM010 TaxID=2745138 RepID=UPI001594EBDB|nr:fibronectin type III domain-containing protein [Myxococcus sp. AM010]NVJ18246.1 fibronectin type III domain-containing protein [Myxococcus sp. AM010]
MNGRIRFVAVMLVGLLGGMGCGGSDDPPPSGPQVTVPQAPTNVAAVVGDAQATVTWAPPANDGGSAILQYTVHVFTGDSEVRSVELPASATQALIEALTNGTAYTFTVVAVNDRGPGSASPRTSPVTPFVVPGAVSNLMAVPGNQEVVLTWEAADGKGMALTGYSVTVQAEDADPESQPVTVTVTETQATVGALTNGAAYTFTVVPDNGHAQGPGSSISASPFTTPGAPSLTADTYLNRVYLHWIAGDTGGRPITDYQVTVSLNDEVVRTEETTELNLNVTGLLTGMTYHYTVVARNEAGWGTVSERITSIPSWRPSPPRNFRCDTSDGNINLTWDLPEFENGQPVLEYRIGSYIGRTYTDWYTSERSISLIGVPREASFRDLNIQARNAVGYGDLATVQCYFTTLSP